MQASTVSETWDASAVSKTLGSRERCNILDTAIHYTMGNYEPSFIDMSRAHTADDPLPQFFMLELHRSV